MTSPLNQMRGVRVSSNVTMFAALGFCLFSVYRAAPDSGVIATSSVAAIAEADDTSATHSSVRLTPIEELQVGDRVRADSPTSDLDLRFGTEVVSADWRQLSLISPKRDGTTADVVLLRPLVWLIEQKAEVGGTVYISVPECGIDGHAKVLSIEPCPQISDGEGRVITGTFRHQAASGISLTVTGQSDSIRCTGNHPIWSETHQKFVRADSLQIGESLRTATGIAHVTDISLLPGLTPVFNLEIHGLHVYHVGTAGVLVHNGDPCPDAEALFNPALRTKTNAPRSLADLPAAQQKTVASLRKRIAEHQKKLSDYRANPDAFDNKRILQNAPTPEIRQQIIDGRIRHLEQEIRAFQNQVDGILGGGG